MTGELWMLHIAILTMLITVAVMVLTMRRLLSAIFMFSIFSLLMAMMYLLLNAPDVAMTEATVGAGISTIFMLAALSGLSRHEIKLARPKAMNLLAAIGCGFVMLYAFADLPAIGDGESPANQHIGRYYIKNTQDEIGIPNAVTAVLASYRGYDTLGELCVIFTAFLGVIAIGGKHTPLSSEEHTLHSAAYGAENRHLRDRFSYTHRHSSSAKSIMLDLPILRIATKSLLPFLFLFGFYVLFHGEVSPGGGFQAGVIFATAMILYGMVFGNSHAAKIFNPARLLIAACSGVAVYIAVGIIGMIDGNFLNYRNIGQANSIMLIETGIALTVAAAMTAIFFRLAEKVKN